MFVIIFRVFFLSLQEGKVSMYQKMFVYLQMSIMSLKEHCARKKRGRLTPAEGEVREKVGIFRHFKNCVIFSLAFTGLSRSTLMQFL